MPHEPLPSIVSSKPELVQSSARLTPNTTSKFFKNVMGGNSESKRARTDEDQEEWFVGSIDQGTTSSRFFFFNSQAEPIAGHQIEFENKYPESGCVVTTP